MRGKTSLQLLGLIKQMMNPNDSLFVDDDQGIFVNENGLSLLFVILKTVQ